MKVAFVSSGNSIHVQKLANGLIKEGHDVTLFTLPNHTNLLNGFDSKVKVDILRFRGKKGYYLNAIELRKKLIKGNYDLLNCHYVTGYGTLARLSRFKPLVASIFGSDIFVYPFKSKLNMLRVIKNLNSANIIMSTSSAMVEKLKEFYKVDKPIWITPFGVDISRFKLKRIEKKTDLFTFGIIKKIDYIYGIDILIYAFVKFLEEVEEKSKYRLVIYGEGKKKDDYIGLVKEMKVEENIIFKGFIQNELVPSALEEIDVICLPSRSESFGVAAVEAMACGVPVIASNAAGFLEIVKKGETGFIVEKENVFELKEQMKRCSKMNEIELKKIGENGNKRVMELFDFEKNIKKYSEILIKAKKQEK